MRRFIPVLWLVSCCLLAQEAPGSAEITQLVDRALAAPQVDGVALEYTADYREVFRTRRWFRSSFKEKVTSGEVYQSWRRPINVPTVVDGQPLPNDAIEANRRKAVHLMQEDLQTQPPKLSGVYGTSFEGISIYPVAFLRQSRWKGGRWANRQGRRSLVLDFEPGPGAVAPYVHLEGTLWIDVQDARLVAVVTHPRSAEKGGETFFKEDRSRQADGSWLCTYLQLNPNASPKLFGGRTWTLTLERSHFRRFEVESGQLEALQMP